MLDFDAVVDLIKQYGYSSTTSHPYVYQNEDSIGICYVYNDEDYGSLERIRIFKDMESFEDFLKEIEWLKENGATKHVRMILDNYEAMAPKVMYLRNEKLMVEGEMYEIENFDFRESQREMMDDASKVIYEAGDLLLVYDEMKGRQLEYLKNIIKLKNSLREKYFELQKEVDEYNKNKVVRELKLLPEVADSGINETLEVALKDKYNMYIAQRPPYDEACEFLKEVWELCKQLELNLKYYDAQKDENDVHNELKIVNQKLELMNRLNDEGRPLFGIDLVGNFRKINKVCMEESTSISQEWINAQVENIERKYAVFNDIDVVNTSDYLREAIQNSNYADLALKYKKGASIHDLIRVKKPLNEVAGNLSIQYNNLTPQEQFMLIIYNNQHFKKICNAILKIDNLLELPVKKVISIISKTKEYSRTKSIIFDAVKKRLNDPVNDSLKSGVFSLLDYSSYEAFITSLINSLTQIKGINTKMKLNGDINMYLVVDNVNEVTTNKFTNVTNALNDLLSLTKGSKSMIGIVLLKENTPVLYSPYYLDIGDVYNKNASNQMAIKEMVDFELLIDNDDVIINIDPKYTNVARYYSVPKTVGDVNVVTDIKLSYKTTFCKYAFTSKLESVPSVSTVPVNNEVSSVNAVNNNQQLIDPNTIYTPEAQLINPSTIYTPEAPLIDPNTVYTQESEPQLINTDNIYTSESEQVQLINTNNIYQGDDPTTELIDESTLYTDNTIVPKESSTEVPSMEVANVIPDATEIPSEVANDSTSVIEQTEETTITTDDKVIDNESTLEVEKNVEQIEESDVTPTNNDAEVTSDNDETNNTLDTTVSEEEKKGDVDETVIPIIPIEDNDIAIDNIIKDNVEEKQDKPIIDDKKEDISESNEESNESVMPIKLDMNDNKDMSKTTDETSVKDKVPKKTVKIIKQPDGTIKKVVAVAKPVSQNKPNVDGNKQVVYKEVNGKKVAVIIRKVPKDANNSDGTKQVVKKPVMIRKVETGKPEVKPLQKVLAEKKEVDNTEDKVVKPLPVPKLRPVLRPISNNSQDKSTLNNNERSEKS